MNFKGIPKHKLQWVICGCCSGSGAVDNPAFSNGITSDELAEWGEDDREHYFRGDYDVRCEVCSGSGKVQTPDMKQMTWADKKVLVRERQRQRAAAEVAEEMAAERRYFGG